MIRAYLRVSPRGHRPDEATTELRQRAIVDAWAAQARPGVSIAWHADHDMSGDTPVEQRPGLCRLLAELEPGDELVVSNWDRLARDVLISLVLERVVTARRATLIAADGVGNGDDPAAVLIRTILAAVAVHERATTRARTVAAMASRRTAGLATSHAPYGWGIERRGKTAVLVPCDEERAQVRAMLGARAAGKSWREVAEAVNAVGCRTRGGGLWLFSSCRKVVLGKNWEG